jgi:hypothetical protein
MIDAIVGQSPLQRLGYVFLADDLGEGVGTVAPVERERSAAGRVRAGIVEQRLILGVLDVVLVRPRLVEPQVFQSRVFHACTLCPDGDNSELVLLDPGADTTRFIVCERQRSRRVHRRDPPRDVRAADLQADPTKRIPKAELIMRDSRFVGFGEDGGSTANIAASEASH